jgi:hypothetical protein
MQHLMLHDKQTPLLLEEKGPGDEVRWRRGEGLSNALWNSLLRVAGAFQPTGFLPPICTIAVAAGGKPGGVKGDLIAVLAIGFVVLSRIS